MWFKAKDNGMVPNFLARKMAYLLQNMNESQVLRGVTTHPYLTFFGGRLFMGSGSYIEGVRTRREALPQYLRGWPRTWEVKVATRVRLPSAATGSRFAQTDHSV